MSHFVKTCAAGLLVLLPLWAQGHGEGSKPDAGPAVAPKARSAAARPAFSAAGRAALASAREQVQKVRGLRGVERARVLESAASAHDKLAAEFAAEPLVAAAAAYAAADLWRQQGSLGLAERDYLQAVQLDPDRFAQRGLMGAADMQRRQQRADEARITYGKAAAIEPGSSRAQDARLWQARLLQLQERWDEAIPAFQAALESADPGAQVIEAANFLALAWLQKGDFDAATHAIDHAEQSVVALGDEDPIVLERLRKSVETMSAKRALQRARDQQNEAGKDAARLDADRRPNKGG